MYTPILPWNQSDDIGTKRWAPDIVYCNFHFSILMENFRTIVYFIIINAS